MKTLFRLLALMLAIITRQRMSRFAVPDVTAPVTRPPGRTPHKTSGPDTHARYHWHGAVFLCLRTPDYYALQLLRHRLDDVLQHVQTGTCSLALLRAERQLAQPS